VDYSGKEAFAIVFATKIFYLYLYGRRFTVFTDHRKRWLLRQEYDIAIGYRSGKMNQNADILCQASLNHIAVSVSRKTLVQGGTK
jgi:RNase H-like domain found in reverse transcriptase